jgi:hypothetical protein
MMTFLLASFLDLLLWLLFLLWKGSSVGDAAKFKMMIAAAYGLRVAVARHSEMAALGQISYLHHHHQDTTDHHLLMMAVSYADLFHDVNGVVYTILDR